jgi:peptidoglycan/xylan/chitin deacetylase (PgdA/CDA1 family)
MKLAFKRIIGKQALTRLAASRNSGSVVILAYHDIGTDTGPRDWLRVSQDEFDRQLTWLGTVGRFIHPHELPGKARGDRAGGAVSGDECFPYESVGSPGLRFLLTFDDGYVNNHRLALPILLKHRSPALFFISTWHTATGEPFWFDRVAVPIQADVRNEIDLRDVGLRLYRFGSADSQSRWDVIQRLLSDMKTLGNAGHPAVERILLRCDELAGERGRACLAECRPLRAEEIRAMYETGLCHFGSHAHRHEILTRVSDAELMASLQASRKFLRTVLAVEPLDVAYPNGNADERVFRAVQAAGFRRGYTAEGGVTRPESSPLRLPRLLVGGYDTLSDLVFKLNRLLLRAR